MNDWGRDCGDEEEYCSSEEEEGADMVDNSSLVSSHFLSAR